MTRIVALLSALLAVLGFWAWRGAPVAMPPSPLAAGERLYCVSYAPFREGQSPLDGGTAIPLWQIEEDFEKLAKLTECVRTYSTELGLDAVPAVARRHGLKVLQGLWLGRTAEKNKKEIDEAVRLANAYPDVIRAVVVGNEVLLRGEMTADTLAQTILAVKTRVPVPVTYADVWEFWLKHRIVAAAVDFVTIHILPYWEDDPVESGAAAAHIDDIKRQMGVTFAGKEIVIGEAGWPSAGRMREGALPSPSNQARAMHDLIALAKRQGYRVNVIEAFDQPWKRRLEGTVGGHWGFLDARTRDFKFQWGKPVSDSPAWRAQAAAGAGLVLMLGVIAWRTERRRRGAVPPTAWACVGAMAVAAGIGVPWAALDLPLESLAWWDWLRNGSLLALGLAAPAVATMALIGGQPLAGLAVVLDDERRRGADRLALALAAVLLLVTVLATQAALGLVFDPRYRGFPVAGLVATVVPLATLALAGRPVTRERGLAEMLAAGVLVAAAIVVAVNETVANRQALATCALWLALALTLVRARAARS